MIRIQFHKAEAFIAAILAFFSASCKSSDVKADISYKMLQIDDLTEEYHAEAQYPVFEPEYSVLNNAVKDYINYQWNSFAQMAIPEWHIQKEYQLTLHEPFPYEITSEVICDGTFINVILSEWSFSGGAHGNYQTKTFCYSLQDKKITDITEATGLSVEDISRYTRSYLKMKGKNEDSYFLTGTEPDITNFSKFYVYKNKVTVLFDPYDIDSYAAGSFTAEFSIQ